MGGKERYVVRVKGIKILWVGKALWNFGVGKGVNRGGKTD